MPVIFVVEGKCTAQPSVSQVLSSEGYFVLPLTSTTEALQTLACVRPNLVVVDDRGARAAAASLRAALGDAAHQVPVMVVHHDAIEDHSICEPVQARQNGADTLADLLLARVRRHVDPMTVPFN